MPLLPQRLTPITISALSQDNEVNQIIAAAKLLEKRGQRVDLAGISREALAALENQRYHTLLMAVQEPVLDRQVACLESALADLPVEILV